MRGFFPAVLVLAVFVGGALYGQWIERPTGAWAAEDSAELPLEHLRELAEVFTLIKSHYVEEISSEELMEKALRGMVSLDPHSAYLSREDLAGFQRGLTSKEYGGVGIYIGAKDGWIEVVSPIYGTPAFRAGMNSGDLILKIDGVSTQGMEVSDAVDKMRGEADTVLRLEVLPVGGGEDVRKLELIREVVVTPSVMSALIGDGYGYLRVTRFQDRTVEDFVKNIDGLYEENKGPLKGLILDLRDNPGGYLDAGVAIAAAFLPSGATVVTDRGRVHKEKIYLADKSRRPALKYAADLLTVPIVVLVNNGSASASEIVAGALQDQGRCVVLGTRTYGKASVQTVQPLRSSKGETAVRLTMARYFTPLGRNIQGRGISPDIVVRRARARKEVSEEDEGFTLREGDIEGHLENSSGAEPAAAVFVRPPFVNEDDFQYEQALLALKAMGIAASAAR